MKGKGGEALLIAQLEFLLQGMVKNMETANAIIVDNPRNFLLCLLWHPSLQEIGFIHMKPMSANVDVVPRTTIFMC